MASLTRSIGFLLFPVAALSSLYSARKLFNPAMIAVGAAAAISLLVHRWFPADIGTYAGLFGTSDFRTYLHEILRYHGAVIAFIGGKEVLDSHLLTYAVTLALTALAVLGFSARLRTRLSIYEVFTVTYLLFLLLYPIKEEPERYSLPVWPLVLLYAFSGAVVLGEWFGTRSRVAVPALLCTVLATLYVARYESMQFGPIPYSVTDPPSRELFSAIRGTLPRDVVLIARKPTIVALFTDRRAAPGPRPSRMPSCCGTCAASAQSTSCRT